MIKAIIVGGAGTIGQALCKRIDGGGGEAFLIGRNGEKLAAVANEFGFGFAPADATKWDELRTAVEYGFDVLGEPNAVINLAGSILLKPAHLTTIDDYRNTIDANLTTAFGLLKATVNRLVEGSSIVLISSSAASVGLAMHEAVAAAKAGVEGLVRSAAATYSGKKLRVNAVSPGLVDTELSAKIVQNPRALDASLSLHALKRVGTADDIAAAIEYLISPQSSWVTGQVLRVDGGLDAIKLIQRS